MNISHDITREVWVFEDGEVVGKMPEKCEDLNDPERLKSFLEVQEMLGRTVEFILVCDGKEVSEDEYEIFRFRG